MVRRRIHDDELYAHFVTFSCYHRRRLLDSDQAKRIVLGVLNSQVRLHDAKCVGFVLMPDHVHAMIWFPQPHQLSDFMKGWKQQSSVKLKEFIWQAFPKYAETIDASDPCWQRRFYPFHIYSDQKLREKLDYMHQNPVRAGIVAKATDWPWSSARWYVLGKSVGVSIEWVQ